MFVRCARYSPDRQLFVCDTPEQADALTAAGWTALPEGYRPDEAVWVPLWADVVLEPKKKPGRPKKAD